MYSHFFLLAAILLLKINIIWGDLDLSVSLFIVLPL
jgi:hypothetical protein